MGTYKVENQSNGPRGFYREGGALVMLETGASIDDVEVSDGEVASAKAVGLTFTGGDAQEPGPLDASVEDLTAHLETVTDADAVEALIAAEKAGKSRKGAITALEARRDAILAG